MADERPPLGGDISRVITELRRLDAKLDAVRADVTRIKEGGTSTQRVARTARAEARTAGAAEADAGVIEDTNRKLADQARVQRQVTTSYGEMAAQRRRVAAESILGQSPRDLQQLRNETASLAQVQAGASTEMRRHGALTTEFLSAAARGDATLAEFRYQIGSTIAKFAGWTAAGAAVFGVLGAIRELGRGAIDSTSGVAGLGRFIENLDTEKAAQGFQDVSRSVNVSIDDVATAQQQFGRIYKSQDDSLTAARVSLLATKLDNVDLANSYRFLTGIAQEFQVPASRLPGLFDQISAAQRRAGGKVSELFPAVARSAAAVRNAGGDLTELIALANAAQVASGQTGQSVGTAFYRAPRFVQKNADVIRGYGIDPTQGFTQLLIDAAKKAQSLGGQERRKLAEAIGGPQLGDRIFAPLLNRYDLLQKSLKVTSPQAAAGSASEELKHKLAQPSEQLKAVGFDLQRIGATLARIGALDPLGGFLKTLNLSLNVLNDVLGLANKLPGPMRQAGVYALEFYGALRLARRFNVGDSLVGGRLGGAAGFLRQSDAQRGQRLLAQSYTNELKARQDEFARLGTAGFATGRAREAAVIEGNQARAKLAYFNSNPPQDETASRRQAQAQRQLIVSEEAFKRRDAQLAAIITEQADQAAVITALQARRNEIEAANTKAQRGALLEQEKARVVPVPGATPPTARQPRPLGETVGAGGAAATRAAADQSRLATQVETAARNNVSTGAAYGLLGAGYNKASTVAKSVGPKIRGAAAAIRTAEVPLLSALGPLDLAIGAFFGLEFALDSIKKRVEGLDKAASTTPTTAAEVQRVFEKTSSQLAAQNTGVQLGPFTIDSPQAGLSKLRDRLLGIDPLAGIEKDQANALTVALAQHKSPILSGKTNYLLGSDTLRNQLKDAKKKRDEGQITLKQYDDALATALKDAAYLPKDERQKLQASITDARSGTAGLSALQLPDLDKRFQAYTALAGSETTGARQRGSAVGSAAQVLAEEATRYDRPSASFDDLQKLAAAQDSFVKSVAQNAQANLKHGLLYARTLDQQDAAYSQAIGATEQGLREIDRRIGSTSGALSGHQAKVKQLEGLRAALAHPSQLVGGAEGAAGLQGLAGSDNAQAALKSLDEQIKSEREKGKAAAGNLKALRKTRADIARAIQDQVKELRDQQVEKEQGVFDLRAQIAAASTGGDSSASTAILIRRAGQKVAAYIQQFGRDDTRTLQAILEQRNLQQQQAQQLISSIGAGYDISIARAADPLAKAQLGVAKVQAELAHAHGDQRKQLLAEYYNALSALDQARVEQAKAEFELQKSQTNDPVRQAAIQLRQDAFELQNASGKTQRLQAQAQLNRDRFAAAETKAQDKISESEFLRSIGKMTNEAEVAILQNLLKQRDISRSTRQQIQKLIYDLKNPADLSSYELTVGSIRLPTTYEVKRAAQEGRSASAQMNVSNRNTFQITVTKDADVGKVYDAIDSALGTSARSNLRSVGAI